MGSEQLNQLQYFKRKGLITTILHVWTRSVAPPSYMARFCFRFGSKKRPKNGKKNLKNQNEKMCKKLRL